jgi:hypothetical protein
MEQPRSGTADAAGAREGASIRCKHSAFNQRAEHSFAAYGVDAEQACSLRKRQREAGHFPELRRYARLKNVEVVFWGPFDSASVGLFSHLGQLLEL